MTEDIKLQVLCDKCDTKIEGLEIDPDMNNRQIGQFCLLCFNCWQTHRLLIHDRNDGVKQAFGEVL